MKTDEKEFGIKFDGEILSILFSGYGRTYRAWPVFQCWAHTSKGHRWNRLNYGRIHLNTNLIDLFDSLDDLLPGINHEMMTRHFSPARILQKNGNGFYSWNPKENKPLPSWYRDNKQQIKEACTAFINTIPAEVRETVGAFRNGYIAGNQWFLIKQSQLYPPFIELMQTNPALAYIFAHRRVLGIKAQRLGRKDTARLLAGKHREITRFLGLSNAKAVPRILKMIPPEACIRHRIQNFVERLKREELWKTMQHLEIIDGPVLAFYGSMVNYPKYFLPRKSFIEDIVSRFQDYNTLLTECFRPLNYIFHYLNDEKHDFASFDQMRNKYQRVIEMLRREDLPARERKYPGPPYPGSDFIEPIANRRELFEEGFDQKNCIYSYDEHIIRGQYYVYRLLSPERATVSLRKERRGPGKRNIWQIEEIKTKANNQPSLETIDSVNQWFERVSAF